MYILSWSIGEDEPVKNGNEKSIYIWRKPRVFVFSKAGGWHFKDEWKFHSSMRSLSPASKNTLGNFENDEWDEEGGLRFAPEIVENGSKFCSSRGKSAWLMAIVVRKMRSGGPSKEFIFSIIIISLRMRVAKGWRKTIIRIENGPFFIFVWLKGNNFFLFFSVERGDFTTNK